jgi:thiamine biosynthesis lipoprotein
MLDIGGDIRCAGAGPDYRRWRVDVPDPLSIVDNAPLAGEAGLADAAIATSGCGPRDVGVDGSVRSATLDPRTGWPVAHRRSATVIAPSAMDADALATAMLVLGEDEAERLAAQLPGVSARVAHPGGSRWIGAAQPHWVEYAPAPQPGQGAPSLWKQGWYADITFEAPPKDMRREIAFRSPYVVLWVSDMNDRPVRTLLLIGRYKEWHEGNHVWWRLNRAKVDSYFAGRSMSTRGSGTYKVYWDGSDDQGAAVAPGKYRLHVETSRESGGHEHRVLDLDFSRPKEFEAELPINARSGGLLVSFKKF